jgi:hypothetical protein
MAAGLHKMNCMNADGSGLGLFMKTRKSRLLIAFLLPEFLYQNKNYQTAKNQ